MRRTTALLLGLLSTVVLGKPIPELADLTREQISLLSDAPEGTEEAAADPWALRRLSIGVSGKTALTLPGLSIEITPDLTLGWERKPSGSP